MELNYINILGAILISAGIFQVLKGILKIPDREDVKRIRVAFGSKENERLLEWAIKLGKYLPLSEAQKKRMEVKLKMVRIELSPQTFLARAIIKGMIPLTIALVLFLLPSHFLTGLVMGLMIILSIGLFLKDFEDINEKAKMRKKEIEWELPRFLDSILQELHYHRDIIKMIENYKDSAGESFKKELEVTIADMKSGNMENALIKLDARLGIPQLSSITRGLLSVIQGEEVIIYFQMLQHDLRIMQQQKLEKIALKRPDKILKYSGLIVLCFLLIYGVVFGVIIMRSISQFNI